MITPEYPSDTDQNSLEGLIRSNDITKVDDLETDALTLFGLITLIVDIEFRTEQDNNSDDKSKQEE